MLPGFVAVYELIIRRSEQGSLDALGRGVLILASCCIVGIVPYLASPFGQWILSGYEIRSFSLVERLLTEARVIWEYLRWIAFPRLESFALFHDDIAVSTSLIDPWLTFPALLGLIGSVILVGLSPVGAFRWLAFGIAWFLIGHSLESTFIPLELVHEHRNYLPLFGVLLLPVGLAGVPGGQAGGAEEQSSLPWSVALLAYLGFVTAMRADMFANESMRTQLEAQFHPDSARTNYEAGTKTCRCGR